MRARPLSPHLTIYRMCRYSLLSSFANRVTGAVLSAGLLLFIYWLTALARGARAYARAQDLLGSDGGQAHLPRGHRGLLRTTWRGYPAPHLGHRPRPGEGAVPAQRLAGHRAPPSS